MPPPFRHCCTSRRLSTEEITCPINSPNLRHELAVANRILAHEGVIDAFGHVSLRHPDDPGRYFLSRSRAPELVEPDDILEFDLDSAAGEAADACISMRSASSMARSSRRGRT